MMKNIKKIMNILQICAHFWKKKKTCVEIKGKEWEKLIHLV